ncbi:unnamed protein product, partial [Symbiodinium pilosum]
MCGPSANDAPAAEPVLPAAAALDTAETVPAESVAPTVPEAEVGQESQPLQPGGGELVAATDLVKCRRCNEPKTEESVGVWKSKSAWWCGDCNKAAKVEFFKRCKAEGQHLSFDRVRSLLVDTLTSTVMDTEKTSEAAPQQAVDTCKTWLEAASQCAGGRSKAALDFDAALLKLRLKAWSDLATRLRKDAPKKAAQSSQRRRLTPDAIRGSNTTCAKARGLSRGACSA